ncbi:MAG: DUF6350 family protein [Micrococcales bacterium]
MFNRRTTFITVALETALAAAVALGILVLPLTVLWVVENNGTIDWLVAYRAAADAWLAAQGVPIQVPAQVIAGVSAPAFIVAIAPLGYTAIVAVSAFRIGQRMASSEVLWPGWVAAGLTYGALSFLITGSAQASAASPDVTLGTYLPPFVFTAVVVAASLFATPQDLGVATLPEARERVQFRSWWRERRNGLGWWLNVVTPPALRAGTAFTVMLLGASALMLAAQWAINWISVIRLYEGMQLSLLGGILLTLGQISLLPNFVVWGADWLTGAGFAIGSGSSVTPFDTQLGPLPALPVFAAIPTGHLALGAVALAVPVVAAAVSAIAVKSHAAAMRFEFASPIAAALSLGIPVGLVAALELAVLNLLASGSIGPGRLAEVGGNAGIVAAVAFVEVSIVATLAAFWSTRPEAPDTRLIARAKLGRAPARTGDIEYVTAPDAPIRGGFEPEN